MAQLIAGEIHDDGVVLREADFLDLAVEPEFVLRIARDLRGVDLPDDVLREAIDGVAAGIELHHYRFHYGPPTSQELIAGNAIHAGVVVGPTWQPLGDLDLDVEGIGIFVDGELVESGIGAEILGGPLRSLRWLVGRLTQRGRVLPAGSLVIPGSATGLIRVRAGQVAQARFTRLGTCTARFV
jgi:2-keto-4-pentenoate hydratase